MSFELFCCECKGQIYPYKAFHSMDEQNVFATAKCLPCWEIENDSCKHIKTICPQHKGSFDCTPFCNVCEAEQEYCSICDEWREENAKEFLAQLEKENN